MRKRLALAFMLAVAIAATIAAAASAGAGEKPITVRSGNLILTLNGGASPKALPKLKLAPVTLHASGHIATADHTHPPALQEIVFDVGKAGVIKGEDFPTCSVGQIEATTTEVAESKCKDAIVGKGHTAVQVLFEESQPFSASGPLVIFNGGTKAGKSVMLIHAYVSVPAPTAIVTKVVTTKEHKGPYRLHTVAKIPVIAGGAGSLTDFDLTIDRKGYLLANCSNGKFSAHATTKFSDGTELSGNFSRPCTAIG